MKMTNYSSFDEYLAHQSSRNQDVIRTLRRLVKHWAPSLHESVKWGNGCWLSDKEPVAYVYSAPDHVQFGFIMGSVLNDPHELLQGTGKFVRYIRLTTRADIAEERFGALLKQAATQTRPRRSAAKSTRRK